MGSTSTAAGDDFIVVETCTDPCGPNTVRSAASTAANDDFIVVKTCTDPCGPNTVRRPASTAADDDFIVVETCTDPCGPNTVPQGQQVLQLMMTLLWSKLAPTHVALTRSKGQQVLQLMKTLLHNIIAHNLITADLLHVYNRVNQFVINICNLLMHILDLSLINV